MITENGVFLIFKLKKLGFPMINWNIACGTAKSDEMSSPFEQTSNIGLEMTFYEPMLLSLLELQEET